MKLFFTIILIFTIKIGACQSTIAWTPNYKLDLSDFKSPQTKINNEVSSYSIFSGAQIDFSFQMSIVEFMLTKNFNSKVKMVFNKNLAAIIAPNPTTAAQLLSIGQYSFDLTELYEKKGAFSDISFFKPILDNLQSKMNAKYISVFDATETGENEKLLKEEHDKVLKEIEVLSDFCFNCKPPKKKRKKVVKSSSKSNPTQ